MFQTIALSLAVVAGATKVAFKWGLMNNLDANPKWIIFSGTAISVSVPPVPPIYFQYWYMDDNLVPIGSPSAVGIITALNLQLPQNLQGNTL